MQAIAKLIALPTLFRRVCLRVGPVLKTALPAGDAAPACDAWHPETEPGESPYRVTDERHRWRRVRHFSDIAAAARHAEATGGVVWERYVGPTGAVNWWSLSEEECMARAGAQPPCAEAAAPRAAAMAGPGAAAV